MTALNQFIYTYPNNVESEDKIYDTGYDKFNQTIFDKKEFRELQLDEKSDVVTERGDLFKHQQTVQRFISPETLYDGLLMFHKMGSGKCHAIDTLILMYDGTMKKVQDIIIGDELMGDDSTKRKVLDLGRGCDIMYDIKPTRGESFTVNSEHILCLKYTGECFQKIFCKTKDDKYKVPYLIQDGKTILRRYKKFDSQIDAYEFSNQVYSDNDRNIFEIEVKEYIKLPKVVKSRLKIYKTGVDFEVKELEVDPYLFGLWLCNSKRGEYIKIKDSSIVKYLKQNLVDHGIQLKQYDTNVYQLCGKIDPIMSFSGKYSIPHVFKANSRENRLKLLAGIIDACGRLNKNTFEITQDDEVMVDDIIYLCRSLGFACHKRRNINSFNISIYGDTCKIPVLNKSKRAIGRKHNKNVLISGFKVVERPVDDYYGFTLDCNNRYVMGDFTVTHNTCSAIAIAENIKNKKAARRCVVLTRGQGLQKNFIDQLLFTCTDGRYIPPNYDNLTDKERTFRTKKLYSKFYNFSTYVTFAKQIQELKKGGDFEKQANITFGETLFIIDEAHNIRLKERENGGYINVYDYMWELFHVLKNKRVLLLTATPMKDTPDELGNIMNLILPRDNQVPTGKNFVKRYISGNNSVKNKDELVEKMKGRVSYLRTVLSDVSEMFIGEKNVGELKHFIVSPDKMSPYQTRVYDMALRQDTYDGDKGSGIFINTRQASLLVGPNDSWGKDIEINTLLKLLNKEKTDNSRLKVLKRYSEKYASTIENIITAQKEKCFIYISLVSGSGAIAFGYILSTFGFSRAGGNETTKGKRYGIITNETTSSAKAASIINRYNQSDNLFGDYIRVIVGSRVIGEGFSLKDTLQCHILTPFWNYTEIDQAIARTLRINAHNNLINAGVDAIVKIYQHVSLPSSVNDVDINNVREVENVIIDEITRDKRIYDNDLADEIDDILSDFIDSSDDEDEDNDLIKDIDNALDREVEEALDDYSLEDEIDDALIEDRTDSRENALREQGIDIIVQPNIETRRKVNNDIRFAKENEEKMKNTLKDLGLFDSDDEDDEEDIKRKIKTPLGRIVMNDEVLSDDEYPNFDDDYEEMYDDYDEDGGEFDYGFATQRDSTIIPVTYDEDDFDIDTVDTKMEKSLFRKSYKSIDLYMYTISEAKDVSIKGLERVMKIASFDCTLNYKRNYDKDARNGTRECDYESCEYKCSGVNTTNIKPPVLQSYQNIYNYTYIPTIKRYIEKMYQTNWSYGINTLVNQMKNYMPDINEFQIVQGLITMINENIPVKDRHGTDSYIRYEGDQIYMVKNIRTLQPYVENYYTRDTIYNDTVNLDEYLDNYNTQKTISILRKLPNTSSAEEKWVLLKQMDKSYIERLVAKAITTRSKGEFNTWLMDRFKNFIFKKGGNIYLTFDGVKSLDKDTDTFEEVTTLEGLAEVNELISDRFKDVIPFYGIIDETTKEFLIRDVSDPTKLNRVKGRVCTTLTPGYILENIIIPANIEPQSYGSIGNMDKKELIEQIKGDKKSKNVFKSLTKFNTNELKLIAYWGRMNKPDICKDLVDWFINNDKVQIRF